MKVSTSAAVLDYIQSNIRNPAELRIKRISDQLHLSENYVGEYFRKNFSISLQEYIKQYRFKIIENRLTKSKLTIGEIAREFGFSSEAHFTTAFRKYKGMSPLKFRKDFNKK